MMLAWLSSSEKITSSLPTSAGMAARLAVKPLWKVMQASAFLNSASLLLQFEVQGHGAGDGAHRARADAVVVDGVFGRGAQPRVVGQAQVVVGAEVEHAPAVDGHPAIHGRFDGADVGEQASLRQTGHLVIDPGKCGWCLMAGHSLSFEFWVVVDRYVLIVPCAVLYVNPFRPAPADAIMRTIDTI